MKPGDHVLVPHRLNALAGGTEPAELISARTEPGPPVLSGPPLAATVVWLVRYSDSTTSEVPEGAITSLRQFQVVITEMASAFEAPAGPNDPTPVVRDIAWTGWAADKSAAEAIAREAWNERHDSPPRGGDVVRITPVPES